MIDTTTKARVRREAEELERPVGDRSALARDRTAVLG